MKWPRFILAMAALAMLSVASAFRVSQHLWAEVPEYTVKMVSRNLDASGWPNLETKYFMRRADGVRGRKVINHTGVFGVVDSIEQTVKTEERMKVKRTFPNTPGLTEVPHAWCIGEPSQEILGYATKVETIVTEKECEDCPKEETKFYRSPKLGCVPLLVEIFADGHLVHRGAAEYVKEGIVEYPEVFETSDDRESTVEEIRAERIRLALPSPVPMMKRPRLPIPPNPKLP